MLEKIDIGKTKRNLLIVLILSFLSISLIISLGLRSNDEIQKIVEEQFNERQLLLSKQISSGISEFLNQKTIIIELMSLHIYNDSTDAISDEFKTVYDHNKDIYVFEFINASGVVITGYPEENTPIGYDLYKFERPGDIETKQILIRTFEWVRDNKETNITRPINLLEGGLGAFIWIPVYEGEEFKGVVLSIIKISDISDKFLKNFDTKWEIQMINDDGMVLYDHIYSNNVGDKYLKHNHSDPHLDQIIQDQLDGKEGKDYFYENGSEKKLIAFSPITWRNEKWSISVITSSSEIENLISSVFIKQNAFIIVSVGFIFLGNFIIILLLSRWSISLENEVKKKTGELFESNKLLTDANEKLKENDKIKSNFLSMVSHELKTPLTAMKISSEFLLDNKSHNINRNELIEILLRNIERLTRLVNNLLDLSKIESGKLKYNMESAQLHEIIDMSVATIKYQYDTKGVNITTDIPHDLSKINIDKDRIIQVFLNLLINALKFTLKGGKVEINAFEHEDHIEVHVKDDGIGIPVDQIDLIFEKFYQIDNSPTRSYPGAGLGLSITKSIMEGHGGSIRVKNNLPKGSVFILTFFK